MEKSSQHLSMYFSSGVSNGTLFFGPWTLFIQRKMHFFVFKRPKIPSDLILNVSRTNKIDFQFSDPVLLMYYFPRNRMAQIGTETLSTLRKMHFFVTQWPKFVKIALKTWAALVINFFQTSEQYLSMFVRRIEE